ncbi:hypothetical protein [Corynebacterium stationis]|nr:hypothetical protein [Corynebacterium stationis]
MINDIITAVSTAFGRVINLVSGFLGGAEEGGVFGAISQLSSGVFGA